MINQQHIDRVHARFSGFSTTRKSLLGILAVAVVAGGVWYSRFSTADSRMEPVLDQPLEPTQLALVTAHLGSRQIPFKTEGGKVLVAADQKLQVLADLLYEDLLPTNTEPGFDAMVKPSIWDTNTKLDHMYLLGKQKTLQAVIGRFPGVRKATVLIDPTSEQRIGGGAVTPTALVDIQTRGGGGALKNSRQLALAAVNVVTGAQSNLARDKVQVTIDGAPCRITDEREAYASAELLERLQQREQLYVAKVRQQLAFIPDALISVSVDVPQDQPAQTNSAIARAASATQASATLVANTGRKLTAAPASVAAARRDAEAAAVLSASVAVPRSYFVRIYQRANPKISEPSDGILQPIIDSELDKIRKLVKTCLAIKSEDDVTVESYYDFIPAAAPTTETASVPLGVLLTSRVSQIAIGVTGLITLVSLPLMLLLRRKTPNPAMVSSRPIHAALLNPRRIDDFESDYADGDRDDDADGSGADDPQHQLEHLAADDPDAAASVVERWITEK